MIDIAAVGNVADISCWSNIPFYFFQEGSKRGIFGHPWNLPLSQFSDSRKYWNLLSLLCLNRPGGYQFSKAFLDKAESLIPAEYFTNTIISFNQVFPRAETVQKAGGKIIYYIDMTLTDLFKDKSYGVHIGSGIRKMALQQELTNYNLAERVITMGNWPLKTLTEIYHLPQAKLGFVLPGANLTIEPDWEPVPFKPGAGRTRDLVLGFVGKDWERKGLGVLIELKAALEVRGFKIRIKVIGNCPEIWKVQDGVDFLGVINKINEGARFISEIAACDIGCLFSKGEALGISLLEFLAVGVPVAGYYHQGMTDTLLPGASLSFQLDDSLVKIADRFETYINDSACQLALKNNAIARQGSVTWKSCLDNWLPILDSLS